MNRIKSMLNKATLLLTLLVFSFGASRAATYYISNSGNDSNTGLIAAQAWKTLNKVNSWTFKPGDQILFQRGSTFYGSLTVKNSGTAANPITYGAYGTGGNPVITGFTTVTSWKNLGSNIWESAEAVSTLETCNMVTVNGVNTAMGRWPNGDYLIYDSNATSSISCSQLNSTNNWIGAEVLIRRNYYFQTRLKVLSQSSNTLSFDNSLSLANGYGFFIQNDARTLDQQNEWYYNPITKKIKIYSTSQPSNVKVASIDYLIFFSNTDNPTSFINIQEIKVEGANSAGIYRWLFGKSENRSQNISINNCVVNFCGTNGISVRANHLTINNCAISDINGTGINAGYNASNLITNNSILNIGLLIGMIQTNAENYYGATTSVNTSNTQNTKIEYNQIINCGYNGINFSGQTTRNTLIKNNLIENFCLVSGDGGGIYGSYHSSAKIDGNIIVNGKAPINGTNQSFAQAVGIYLDDNTDSCEVMNNTVFKASCYGLQYNSTSNINTHDNTIIGSGRTELRLQRWSGEQALVNNSFRTNKFITLSSNQKVMNLISFENDIPKLVFFDDNNYCGPTDNSKLISINQPNSLVSSMSLEDWKKFSNQDGNSKSLLLSDINNLLFKYNASKEPLIVSIDQPMVDVKGIKYYGKHTLLPYTSVVLLKAAQTPVATTEYKTICEGTSYNGWTTSGKYELKTVDTKGNFAIVAVNLTVIPVSKVTENITINEGENYNGWKQTGTYTRKLTAVSGCDSLVTTNLVVIKLINKQGEVLPTHYTPAGLNSTGQSPMSIRIEGAEQEDMPLTTGDEIAVFSGATCVGAIRLSHPIQATDVSTFATLTVYPRTSTYSGFVPNDTIVFKIWSAQQQKEFTINQVNYKKDQTSWATSGKFSSGSAAVVELFSYTELTQSISLKQGYNLISAYVAPANTDAGQVLKSLAVSGSLSKVQDEAGNAYENWGTAGGWVNSIGLIEETEGYKVRVNADCTLKITGRPVALPLDIPLVEGWNLIAYPRMDEVNAMSVIQSLIDENKLIKVQDEDGSAIENWQAFGGWVNGIGNFVPGKAYKVKVSASTVLHINDTYLKAAVVLAQSAQPEHFFSITEGNGTDHMNINLSGLNESELQVGDELGAFDGSVCVGSLKVTPGHLDSGLAVITASYKTDASVKDGFTEGNSIQLRIWKQQTGAEVSANLICTAGRLVYERNASVFVQLKSVALTTSVSTLSNSSEVVVYPNPSDGAFTVKFDQMPDEGSRIDILDLSGKKITSRLVSWYAEDFNLAGQAPGVYLVKSTQGSKEVVRKLIIN